MHADTTQGASWPRGTGDEILLVYDFRRGSATVLPEHQSALLALIADFQLSSPRPQRQVKSIIGFTDCVSQADRNRGLRLARAGAVQEFLIGHGVGATSIITAGEDAGAARPGDDSPGLQRDLLRSVRLTIAPAAAAIGPRATPPQRFVVEIKAWIPVDHVVDPEEFLRRQLDFPTVVDPVLGRPVAPVATRYRSRYRGDGHVGYAGGYRIFESATLLWDGTRISEFSETPGVAHFGTTHRDFDFDLANPMTGEITSGQDSQVDTAKHAVTARQAGTEVELSMASANPIPFVSPDVDATLQVIFSAGFGRLFVSWRTDLMPNHGFRIERDGTTLHEEVTNDVSGVDLSSNLGAVDIARRLNVQGNVGTREVAL